MFFDVVEGAPGYDQLLAGEWLRLDADRQHLFDSCFAPGLLDYQAQAEIWRGCARDLCVTSLEEDGARI